MHNQEIQVCHEIQEVGATDKCVINSLIGDKIPSKTSWLCSSY